MTALVDPYAWPPHPMIAALQTRATTAETKLAAVTALAHEWEQRAAKCRVLARRPTVTLGQSYAYLQDAGIYADAARALRAAIKDPS